MLEIICLIWLWRVNGKHAIERGQNPKKYRALTLGLWFGLEFTGTFVGAWLMQLLNGANMLRIMRYSTMGSLGVMC